MVGLFLSCCLLLSSVFLFFLPLFSSFIPYQDQSSCPTCSGIPSTQNSPGTSICHRSTSRPYHSRRCSLFACTWKLKRPHRPLQVTFGSQVIFTLKPSSGRRRNNAHPPARRSRDRAVRGARPAFRPSVPDFRAIISQIISRQYR